MVASVLKISHWVAFAALAACSAGCSLVVDTAECDTDVDCEFEDGSAMQCVSNECVPATRQMALVATPVSKDTRWSDEFVWIVSDVVVVEPGASLEIAAGTNIEIAAGGALVFEDGATLVVEEDADKPVVVRACRGADSILMVDALPVSDFMTFETTCLIR